MGSETCRTVCLNRLAQAKAAARHLDFPILFATWMDTYAPRTGHYSEEQEKELVKLRERLSTSIAPATMLGSPAR